MFTNYLQRAGNISLVVCRARGLQQMRGKNKNKYRSLKGFDEDDFSGSEDGALFGMSPYSRSAPIHTMMSTGSEWKNTKPPVTLKARNEKQTVFLKYLNDPNVHIIISSGSAGTGKTFMSVSYAMERFQAGDIRKIVITRPMVGVDNASIGFLPGSQIQKCQPFLLPIMDTMHKYMNPPQLMKLMENNTIEVCPLIHMRGRSFENCLIIADEMQNSTPSQMLMLLTRIGQGSKLIITGDPMQHDRGFEHSGFSDIVQKLEKHPQEGMEMVHFTDEEVERHPIIKKILRLYHTKTVPAV